MGMATTKVTFTLDEAMIERLQQAAACLALPKSEASDNFSDRIGRLKERERSNLLRTFDELVPRIPQRTDRQVGAPKVRCAAREAARSTSPSPPAPSIARLSSGH